MEKTVVGCVLLCLLQYALCYDYWNSTQSAVELPSHLQIDAEHDVLIVAAKNSICHLSLDLQDPFNIQSVEPNSIEADNCQNILFEPPEDCQNYPHVLTLPSGSFNITSRNGTEYPITETVLFCGSNAFSPECTYRHRNTLEALRFDRGVGFLPYKFRTGVVSMWSSTGRLVSATTLDNREEKFGITVSNSPYNGYVSVSTLLSNRNWFHNSPNFVSIHEIGDYFYVFFQEEALEAPENVIYSRVARVCKNDTGSSELAGNSDTNIFTTFLKARISCTSGTGTFSDIPFHYNEIQDTFFIPSGSSDGVLGDQEQLYAVFTSARNGPTGSAVCAFTFGTETNDIGGVFDGDYLQLSGEQWETVTNYRPFTCETGDRELDHARSIQLMKPTVASSNGPHPLIISEEYLFDKIVVSQIKALDNKTYDTLFIAAHSTEELVMMKATLTEGQQYRVISTEVLGTNTKVSQMKLSKQGADGRVYLSTSNGVYGLPVASCSVYTDCCSCIAARDPFCGFDSISGTCASVSSLSSANGIQDVSNGHTSLCPTACGDIESTTDSPATSTTMEATATDCAGASTAGHTDITFNSTFNTPSIGGLPSTDNSTKLVDHTWTIVGSVVGFAAGVFLGIIVTAFFFRRSNIFYHAKSERARRRRRIDLEERGNERKSLTNSTGRGHHGASASCASKREEYVPKNNNVHMNDYTSVHPVKSSPGCATKFSTKYPSLHCESSQTNMPPVPVPPPTPPFKKTVSTFSFDTTSVGDPPEYTAAKTDPNVKSNIRTEERITNQQRAAYGRNILGRAPSIDASKHSKYSKTTVPVVSPQLRFGTKADFAEVSGAETGCSHC